MIRFLAGLIVALGLGGAVGPGSLPAQHSISTRSGLVNRLRGHAFVRRVPSENPEPVAAGLQMTDGDSIFTEFMGRVEIIVNPAAYLSLDEVSEVRAVNTRLTETCYELLRGVFVIQAGSPGMLQPNGPRPPQADQRRPDRSVDMTPALAFEVRTPHGILTVAREGLYRISIDRVATWIEVYEGAIALGARAEAVKARKVKRGKRVQLSNASPAGTETKEWTLKIPKAFDRWRFAISPHGVAVAVEGKAFVMRPDQTDPQLVAPEFELKAGQMLSTETRSYLELQCPSGPRMCLDQQTLIKAVSAESEGAVFELQHGNLLVDSGANYSRNPVKIRTPQDAFTVEPGCVARFDVSGAGTAVRVWHGQVKSPNGAISRDRRLLLGSGPPLRRQLVDADRSFSDSFERRSMGLMRAGIIQRHEGAVILEREAGARLELDKALPELRVQMLETAHLFTWAGGRASLSFGAGSLHVNEESEIIAVSSSEQAREFAIQRGAVIVYADGGSVQFTTSKLRISSPYGSAQISGTGVFRFDVGGSGMSIRVRTGSLRIATRAQNSAEAAIKVKAGQSALLAPGSGAPRISPLSEVLDDFDRWSVGAHEFPFQRVRKRM